MSVSQTSHSAVTDWRQASFILILLNDSAIPIAPGQARPIGFMFDSCKSQPDRSDCLTLSVICDGSASVAASVNLPFNHRNLYAPHKFTFRHPGGVVSYAILRPPINHSRKNFPILIALHGAGLEADSPAVRHALDEVRDLDAWVLFPTGMSPWSGDDWHVWGLADVLAGVAAVPQWMEWNHWSGPGVDVNRWCVVGHSNGGQGAWHIATHYPDKTIAVASASGYSSIQNYVPYTMWQNADPLAYFVAQNSLSGYRHELLMSNLVGMSIFQQHGAKDDNVPAFHSRLLSTIFHEAGIPHQYNELPKQGHWFEGVMTTPAFRDFYSSVLERKQDSDPTSAEYIIPNSGDIGSFGGLVVDQLESPDTAGKIKKRVLEEGKMWEVTTNNIRRLHLDLKQCVTRPKTIGFNGQPVDIPESATVVMVRTSSQWKTSDPENWKTVATRYGRQRGSLDSSLRATGPFCIESWGSDSFNLALQVSRNFLQYFGADSELSEPGKSRGNSFAGNFVILALGSTVPTAHLKTFPIEIKSGSIHLDTLRGQKIIPIDAGMGAAFLRPRPQENLELIIWGIDKRGLQQAARMVPSLTGAGQPDFVIFRDEARWKGIAGVMAMGFLDYRWQISQASYCF